MPLREEWLDIVLKKANDHHSKKNGRPLTMDEEDDLRVFLIRELNKPKALSMPKPSNL
jgi:hypothetical protein